MIKNSQFLKQNYCLVIGLVLLLFQFQETAAQINKLTVKVPDFKRFVVITQDKVNVRRTPSVNGGRLMQWESDGGSFDTYCKIFLQIQKRIFIGLILSQVLVSVLTIFQRMKFYL